MLILQLIMNDKATTDNANILKNHRVPIIIESAPIFQKVSYINNLGPLKKYFNKKPNTEKKTKGKKYFIIVLNIGFPNPTGGKNTPP